MLAGAQGAEAQYVPHMDIRANWGFLLVPVAADGCPIDRADSPLAELRAQCAEYATKAVSSKRRSERQMYANVANDCGRKYDELYIPLLAGKYSRADFDAVATRARAENAGARRIECLLAESHNERVNAEIDARQAEWDALENEHNARAAQTDAEIARLRAELAAPAAPPAPTPLQALGLILQGMGQGLAGAGAASGSPAPTAPGRSSCRSDYECAYGFACVKAPFALEGYCAQKVNEYGTPTYAPPSSTSVAPGGPGQCGFDADCPVGFRCAIERGALRGACLRR